jgi:hypothetical protein
MQGQGSDLKKVTEQATRFLIDQCGGHKAGHEILGRPNGGQKAGHEILGLQSGGHKAGHEVFRTLFVAVGRATRCLYIFDWACVKNAVSPKRETRLLCPDASP